MSSKAIVLVVGLLLFMTLALFGVPSKSAQAQAPEPAPGTLTIVKECVSDDDETDVFNIILDVQVTPDIDESPDSLVDEDTAFDIDDIELRCDEFIDLTADDDLAAVIAWFEANEEKITGMLVTVGEASVPANVTVSFSGDCFVTLVDIEAFFEEGLVCVITNTFAEGGIDIDNTNTNTLNNVNDNGNNNENENTQKQSNTQIQTNENNQTTTVNSSPSVKITGLPRAAAAPPVTAAPPPSTGPSPTTVLAPPRTGEFGFIAPPRTGDAGLAGTARSQEGVWSLILLGGIAGALTLAGVKFSRAGR